MTDANRSLYEKLGVKADEHVAYVGPHDSAFLLELNARLQMAASETLRTDYDMIFVRLDAPDDVSRVADAVKHLRPTGTMWIGYPKTGTPSADEVRAAARAASLTDHETRNVTDTHNAIRFTLSP